MAVSKDSLRINKSNYYRIPSTSEEPKYHTVVKDETGDLSKVAIREGFTHAMWPVIGRFNGVVDPINELSSSKIALIPSIQDFKNLQKV